MNDPVKKIDNFSGNCGMIFAWNCPSSIDTSTLSKKMEENEIWKLYKSRQDLQISPKKALTRAFNELVCDKLLDIVHEDACTVEYQITDRAFANNEWVYSKKGTISLNKIDGSVTCTSPEIEENLSKLLVQKMAMFNRSDLNSLINNLLSTIVDIIPFKKRSGVYFVPQIDNNGNKKDALDNINRIIKFINDIGGNTIALHVNFDNDFVSKKGLGVIIEEYINGLIDNFKRELDKISVHSRGSTIEEVAESVQVIKNKIQAYSMLLEEKSKQTLDKLNSVVEEMTNKITTIEATRETNSLDILKGVSNTAVIKWMGANGWTYTQAKKVLDKKGVFVSESTIRGQLWCGKTGRYGKAPDLTEEQIKELQSLLT